MGFTDALLSPFSPKKEEPEESAPSEETPLAERTTGYLKRQGANLARISREGPLSFRILAFLGGILMVVASVVTFIESIVPVSLPGMLIAIYAFLFGVLIIVIEGKVFEVPEEMRRTAKFYFRVVDFTWGRGCIYAFAGSLLLTQPSRLNVIVGFFLIGVGIVAIISSVGAGMKLMQLRIELDSKRDLKREFQQHDFNGDGALIVNEFASFCSDLGVDVTYQELVACFNAIDKNDDERITYDELSNWWTQWGSKHLHRSLSDLMV